MLTCAVNCKMTLGCENAKMTESKKNNNKKKKKKKKYVYIYILSIVATTLLV